MEIDTSDFPLCKHCGQKTEKYKIKRKSGNYCRECIKIRYREKFYIKKNATIIRTSEKNN
jgi:late competence protein required for DNA uptake (superfamily II DNA/RNA helicase)